MTDILELTTTVETREQAQSLANIVLDAHLAACIQLTPIHSFYRWDGKACSSEEIRCTMKTTDSKREDLKRVIQQNHPYDVPEILVLEVVDAHVPYRDWVHEQTRSN